MSLLGDLLLEELVKAAPAAFNTLLGKHGPIRPDELDLLAERARDRDGLVRRNATVLLGLGRTDDRHALLRVLARETTDPEVFVLAAAGLPDAKGVASEKPGLVRQALHAADPRAVTAAVRLAALSELPGVGDQLRSRLEDPDPRVRDAALATLAATGAGPLEPMLRQVLADPAQRTRYSLTGLYRALLHSDDPTTADAIAASLVDAEVSDQVELVNALAAVPRKPWVTDFLLAQLRAPAEFRWAALRALAQAPAPPLAEMVPVCRDYLAAQLASGTPLGSLAMDAGVSATAAFLGRLAGHSFPDLPAVLAYATHWTPAA
jgi:hypothetical protein